MSENNKSLAPTTPVQRLLSQWHTALDLRVKAGELAQNTADTYKRSMYTFLDWCDVTGVSQVDANVIREWKSDLLINYSINSINTWLQGVKRFFEWAETSGYLPRNPATNIKTSTKGSKRHKRDALTDEEVKRVLSMPNQDTEIGVRDYAILVLFLYTGVRTVELQRSSIDDIKIKNGKMLWYVHGKGRRSSDDFVVVPRKARAALDAWLIVRGKEPGGLFLSYSDRSKGSPLSLRAIRGIVKNYFRDAGISEDKTTHCLRHTAITNAIRQGADPLKVRSMARHASLDTTMIYYHDLDRIENPAEEHINYD